MLTILLCESAATHWAGDLSIPKKRQPWRLEAKAGKHLKLCRARGIDEEKTGDKIAGVTQELRSSYSIPGP